MELLEPEIKILNLYVRGLIRMLNMEKTEFSFTDFQVLLSNTANLLPFSTTATIINILKSREAITEMSENRKRTFIINKEKMRELINSLIEATRITTKGGKQ